MGSIEAAGHEQAANLAGVERLLSQARNREQSATTPQLHDWERGLPKTVARLLVSRRLPKTVARLLVSRRPCGPGNVDDSRKCFALMAPNGSFDLALRSSSAIAPQKAAQKQSCQSPRGPWLSTY